MDGQDELAPNKESRLKAIDRLQHAASLWLSLRDSYWEAESLQRVGYDCVVATSGSDGARKIDKEDFDVILTDLKMPDMDGLALLRKARQEMPEAEVVVITGHGDVKTAVEAIQQGAANYLTKPLDMAE